MIRNIKLTIEYDGTNFQGWQIQKKGTRTVQGEITKALKLILKESVKVIGSGRTDSGVHALGQVAHIKTQSSIPATKLKKALNGNLPKDIAILKVENVRQSFHAQYSVKTKTYRYRIDTREPSCVFQKNFSLYYPYKLNLPLIRSEAKALIGRKDFKSFQSAYPKKQREQGEQSTVRIIKAITIRRTSKLITIDIEANGFLYKMVRNIVGTLLDIGRGRLEKGSIKKILSQKNRIFAGTTAKANGLYLAKVLY